MLVLDRIPGAPKAAVGLLSYLLSVELELPMSPKSDIQSYCSKWESVKTICESALVVVFFGVFFFFFFSVNKSFVILTRNRTDIYTAPSRFWFGKHQRESPPSP